MAASIVVREFNRQTFFNTNADNFSQVATVITSTWGPCITSLSLDTEDSKSWVLITAGDGAVENFQKTYGDPDTSIPGFEKSYSIALALLASGYDILVCRLSPGLREQFIQYTTNGDVEVPVEVPVGNPKSVAIAKYIGSYGNRISYSISKVGKGLELYFRLRVFVDKILVEAWDLQPSDLTQIANRPNLTASDISSVSQYLTVFQPIPSSFDFGESSSVYFYPVGMASDTGDVTTNKDKFPAGWQPLSDPINPEDFNPADDVIVYVAGDGVIDPSLTDKSLTRTKVTAQPDTPPSLTEASKALISAREGEIDTGVFKPYEEEARVLTDSSRSQHCLQAVLTMMTGVKPSITSLLSGSAIPGVYAMLSDYFRYAPKYVISPISSDIQFAESPTMHSLHFCMWFGAAFGRGARAIIDYPSVMDPKYASTFSANCERVVSSLNLKQDDSKPNNVFLDGYPASFGSTIGPNIIRVLPEYSSFPTDYPASMGYLLGRIKNKDNFSSSMAYYPQGASSAVEAESTVYDIGKNLYSRWQKDVGSSSNPIRLIPLIGYTCFGDNTWMSRSVDHYNPVESAQIRDIMNWVRDWVFQIGINLCLRLNNAEADQIFVGMLQPKLVELKNANVIANYKIIMSPNVKALTAIKRRTKVGSVRLEIPDIIENVDVGLYMYPVDSGLV